MWEEESRAPIKALPLLTSGCKDPAHGQLLKELMQTPNFRITVVQEVDTVEICGALKVRGVQRMLWGEKKVLKEGLA